MYLKPNITQKTHSSVADEERLFIRVEIVTRHRIIFPTIHEQFVGVESSLQAREIGQVLVECLGPIHDAESLEGFGSKRLRKTVVSTEDIDELVVLQIVILFDETLRTLLEMIQ